MDVPFQVGALYNRQKQIHALLGGQRQGGISTPKDKPVIIAFTGDAGASHGYRDFWDDDGIFHYYGEGQIGDMRHRGGNRAIEQHIKDGRKPLVFQMMGEGRQYRYLGQFVSLSSYVQPNTPDTKGDPRNAIVFRLQPIDTHDGAGLFGYERTAAGDEASVGASGTAQNRVVQVRTKQRLFRERLISVERGCRLTGIEDLRFLRANHIKPWAISEDSERVDGQNGLLLAPNADLLFDRGWISFEDCGKLMISSKLPPEVGTALGLNLRRVRGYGAFEDGQRGYLAFHRERVFEPLIDKIVASPL